MNKGYKKKNCAWIVVPIVVLIAVFALNAFLLWRNVELKTAENKKKTEQSEKENVNKTEQAGENGAESISEFKKLLLAVLKEKGNADGLAYTLDADFYKEDIMKKYLAVRFSIGTDKIEKKHISQAFNELFHTVSNGEEAVLVQKDERTFVAECETVDMMNEMDSVLLGTQSKKVNALSKGFYISQNSPEYAKMAYSTSTVKKSGCGPVSVAMAINYIKKSKDVTVKEVVDWAVEKQMYQPNAGTSWSLISEYPPLCSVDSKELYIGSPEEFEEAVPEGGVLIAVMSPGHFTDVGHFIVITDVSDGMVTVLDPASIYRTEKKWDAQLVLGEARGFWKLTAQEQVKKI